METRRRFVQLLASAAGFAALPAPVRRVSAHVRDRMAAPGDVVNLIVRGPFRSPMSSFQHGFKVDGPLQIADGKRRTLVFMFDGWRWHETARTSEY